MTSRLAALPDEELSVLDLADRLLNRGVVIAGEATISVAGVDLIYLGLNVILAATESIAQLEANFPATRKSLVDRGYDHSNMPKRNICILSPTVAVISGRGIRYLKENKVMAEFGWTYTLIKGADGWKMVSIYSHDPNKALTCSANGPA